jgi:hypothetical protein
VVLNDGTGTTLDGEETGHLKDDILRGGPARHLTSEADTNDVRGLQLPRETSHNIDGISTTDTNSGGSKTTSIRGVRVSTDDQTTGESVVLKNDLVNDTGTGLPETDVVLGGRGGKEVVDLLVDLVSAGKILLTSNLGLNQVVTVDGGGSLDAVHASGHELQNSHLGSGILASNAVGAQLEVRDTTLDVLAVRVVKVRVEDLLGVSERTLQTGTDDGEVLGHLLVVDVVALRCNTSVAIALNRARRPFLRDLRLAATHSFLVGHLDLLVEGVIDSSEGPGSAKLYIEKSVTAGLSYV